jgi:hypothetical protein
VMRFQSQAQLITSKLIKQINIEGNAKSYFFVKASGLEFLVRNQV